MKTWSNICRRKYVGTYGPCSEKTRSDTNRAVKPQKMARDMKFRI